MPSWQVLERFGNDAEISAKCPRDMCNAVANMTGMSILSFWVRFQKGQTTCSIVRRASRSQVKLAVVYVKVARWARSAVPVEIVRIAAGSFSMNKTVCALPSGKWSDTVGAPASRAAGTARKALSTTKGVADESGCALCSAGRFQPRSASVSARPARKGSTRRRRVLRSVIPNPTA